MGDVHHFLQEVEDHERLRSSRLGGLLVDFSTVFHILSRATTRWDTVCSRGIRFSNRVSSSISDNEMGSSTAVGIQKEKLQRDAALTALYKLIEN